MSFRRGIELARFGVEHLGKMKRGRRAVESHLERPATAPLPMPTFVQLRVTNLCNLRCKMCGQWGDTGIYRPDGSNPSATDGEAEKARIRELVGVGRQMSLDDYVRLLDEITPFDPIISLFGGEPLLYPDIVPLVREIKRRKLTLTVITNGGKLETYAKDLVEAGIDCISVSIDGPPDLHNRIRGASDSFERLAAGVRAVDHWRKKLGRPVPMQIAILPVTELNIERIGETVELLRGLPLDTVNIGLRWFVSPDAGAEYEKVMKETFGVSGDSWKGFDFTWPGGAEATKGRALTDLVKLLRGLKRRRFLDGVTGRPWTSFVPDVATDDVPSYLTDFSRTFGHNLCPVAWYFAQIEPDGEVCFCGDFPDYFIGNVRKNPFGEIWRGERAMAFREKLAKEPLPICNRCCGNFVYGKWSRPAGRR